MKRTILNKRIMAVLITLVVMATTYLPVQRVAAEVTTLAATNITFSSARELQFNTSMSEELSESDAKRFYKFTLGEASELNIGMKLQDNSSYININVYDATKTEVYQFRKGYSRNDFATDSIYLTGGTYYMQISSDYRPSRYSFTATMDTLSESFTETQDSNNNMISSAYDISLKTNYKGVIAQNDDIDYYKFTVPANGKINFNMSNPTNGKLEYSIYDRSINLSYRQTINQSEKLSEYIPLTAGNYYLVITKDDIRYGVGSYSFNIDYSVTIPDKPVIESVENTSVKKITVKWNKVTGADGYELQYSQKSNFNSGVVKKTISNNKKSASYAKLIQGKKYYVRMRAYVNVNGEKKYSVWSSKKLVTIKK